MQISCCQCLHMLQQVTWWSLGSRLLFFAEGGSVDFGVGVCLADTNHSSYSINVYACTYSINDIWYNIVYHSSAPKKSFHVLSSSIWNTSTKCMEFALRRNCSWTSSALALTHPYSASSLRKRWAFLRSRWAIWTSMMWNKGGLYIINVYKNICLYVQVRVPSSSISLISCASIWAHQATTVGHRPSVGARSTCLRNWKVW